MAAFKSELVSEKKYSYKPGSRFSVDADTVGKVCEQLESEGNLSAKALVDISRPEEASTHKLFEWRDDVAAEKYREWQGRNVLNHLEVVLPEYKEPVRGFISLISEKNEYHSTSVLLEEEDTREKLLETALAELRAFERKYRILTELAEIFAAIDDVLDAS